LLLGELKPEFFKAEAIRSLDSYTALSGKPTTVKEKRDPVVISTSTETIFPFKK